MSEYAFYKTIERILQTYDYQLVPLVLIWFCNVSIIAVFLYHGIRHGNLIECIRSDK